jgi:hypothetical protein
VEAEQIAERTRIFRALLPYFGTAQRASFFRHTSRVVPGVERIHPLIAEGIYKPGNSVYALAIGSFLDNPYHDQIFHNSDRTWWMHYSPKRGRIDAAVNASVIRCKTDRQPILAMRQESDKTSAAGARHLLPDSRTHVR